MNYWNIGSAGLAYKVIENWPVDPTPVFTTQGKYTAIIRKCSDHSGNLTGGVVVKVCYNTDPKHTHTHEHIISTRKLRRGASDRSTLHAIARCYTDCMALSRLCNHREALYKLGHKKLPSAELRAHAEANNLPMAYNDMSIEDCGKWHNFLTLHLTVD